MLIKHICVFHWHKTISDYTDLETVYCIWLYCYLTIYAVDEHHLPINYWLSISQISTHSH